MAEKKSCAVIKSGGKQYLVAPGDIIDVELLHKEGPVEFKEILYVRNGDKVDILPSKMVVKGEVLSAVRGPKVVAYKYKKRKNYRRKVGHRQNYSRIKITQIG